MSSSWNKHHIFVIFLHNKDKANH